MVDDKPKTTCPMFGEGCPPDGDCASCWPTCEICGALLPFWGDSPNDAPNGFIIHEGGFQCSDEELMDEMGHLCKSCYEKHIKPYIGAFKVPVEKRSCRNCGKGKRINLNGELHFGETECTTSEGNKCLIYPKNDGNGVWVYAAWIPDLTSCKINEFIDAAKRQKGLVLRNQEIKGYANGPKILIKKPYIDDGILDFNKKYVVILVPEECLGEKKPKT